ncbi:unnamed protein product [Chondrus crispus]|uniref:Uncharacterized protein n=1 Tax=Chondrus crispus TaxID=2769 RepID=R7QPF9_CHOCR|nr:unnamed protein product [Chondrus crispus]CDF39658.1 unnamed protein product [Chondrus crispus]|eukprot:XP_005709952.1 unnamed protein product [Chondrus crispus]
MWTERALVRYGGEGGGTILKLAQEHNAALPHA